MKKIILGIMAIALTVGLVSGAAYAVFSDTVIVSGIAIATGNADLKIWDGTGYVEGLEGLLTADGMYPGWIDGQPFALRNDSASNIGLDVTAQQLTGSPTGDWSGLRNKVEVAILEYSTWAEANEDSDGGIPGGIITPTHNTGWVTLSDWYYNEPRMITVDEDPIAQDEKGFFVVWARVSGDAGNEIAEMDLNTAFVLVGTQDL